MEGLLPFSIADITPSALLLIVVFLIIKGSLVPRKTLTDSQKATEIWRLACERQENRSEILMAANAKYLEQSLTMIHLLKALPTIEEPPAANIPPPSLPGTQ